MRRNALSILLLVLSQAGFAQSLTGTWVSDALLLKTVDFRLTFRSDMSYEIDTTLGRTTGTYTYTEDKISFTPIHVGMSAGKAGDNQDYYYTFGDGYLYLHANGVKVKLRKVETVAAQGEGRGS